MLVICKKGRHLHGDKMPTRREVRSNLFYLAETEIILQRLDAGWQALLVPSSWPLERGAPVAGNIVLLILLKSVKMELSVFSPFFLASCKLKELFF